jgi:hypothetical protein
VVFLDETTRHREHAMVSISREAVLALLLAGLAAVVSGDSGASSNTIEEASRGRVRTPRLSAVQDPLPKETVRKRAANPLWSE